MQRPKCAPKTNQKMNAIYSQIRVTQKNIRKNIFYFA